jgi:hypothetical protein
VDTACSLCGAKSRHSYGNLIIALYSVSLILRTMSLGAAQKLMRARYAFLCLCQC